MIHNLKLILLVLICCSGNSIHAQYSGIQWSKCYGGSADDRVSVIKKTTDNGYILVGTTNSYDGDVCGYHGLYSGDIWVLKLTNNGKIQWQNAYGGTKPDYANDIIQTNDGGYIIAGRTISDDGDVSLAHLYNYDAWIVKLKNNGTIEWQKTLGGTKAENALSILQTADGGYIFVGSTNSGDGDVSGYHVSATDERPDMWLVKLNNAGSIEWQKAMGTDEYDGGTSIAATNDGGYIIAGGTKSLLYSYDGWLVKVDATGNVQWQTKPGSSAEQESFSFVRQTYDGGFIAGGVAYSSFPITGGNHGQEDIWITKFSSTGALTWQKWFGGSSYEGLGSIIQTADSGYLLAGDTYSEDGDVSGLKSAWSQSDAWIIKLSKGGIVEYQKIIGGSNHDYAQSIIPTDDSGIVIACNTYSNDKDVSGNHGYNDFWIAKINSDTTNYSLAIEDDISEKANIGIYPTLTNGTVNIELPTAYEYAQIKLTNYLGQLMVFRTDGDRLRKTLYFSDLPDGLYLLQVINENTIQTFRIHKQS